MVGDVSNAYVNAHTNEKVYAIAGKEFGELEGKIIIIKKALYGLATSGERWHKHFADSLLGLGFKPTRYDRDVWLRKHKSRMNTFAFMSMIFVLLPKLQKK